MTIETRFNIGDTARPVDERDCANWGAGIIEEIHLQITGQRVILKYYVKMKKQGGYRLCKTETEIVAAQ